MRKIIGLFFLPLLSWLLLSISAHAHQLSTAYLSLSLDNKGLATGALQLRLYDLEQAIGVDGDGDGKLRWQEVQSRAQAIEKYVEAHLSLARANKSCSLKLTQDSPAQWQIDTHFNEAYLLLPVLSQCALAGDLQVNYSAFIKEDSEHKLVFTLRTLAASHSRVLSNSQTHIALATEAGNPWATFVEFVYQGMMHIWIGLDHILFLVSLLLTAVLVRRKGAWQAEPSIKTILVNTLWIVTAFTLAHSITLTASALNWIRLPSAWVELGIAISVLLVALNNIFTLVIRLGSLTFAFGLLHGMGFAGVLGELGLPADQYMLTILAFNLGVELGQMVIVLMILPLMIGLRNKTWYSNYSLIGISAVIALVALEWLIERW